MGGPLLQLSGSHAIKWVNFDSSLLLTFPIASFAFNLQPYIFSVFYEDENMVALSYRCNRKQSSIFLTQVEDLFKHKGEDKETRNKHIVYVAMGISFMIYMTAGIFGYMHFGENTESNILLNYELNSTTWVVYVVMISTILVCFPLNVFPLREMIDDMIKAYFVPQTSQSTESNFSWCRHIAETVAIILAALTVSVIVDDVGVVFGITGATACTAVAYVLPCAFSSKLQPSGWTYLLGGVTGLSAVIGGLSLYQIMNELFFLA